MLLRMRTRKPTPKAEVAGPRDAAGERREEARPSWVHLQQAPVEDAPTKDEPPRAAHRLHLEVRRPQLSELVFSSSCAIASTVDAFQPVSRYRAAGTPNTSDA